MEIERTTLISFGTSEEKSKHISALAQLIKASDYKFSDEPVDPIFNITQIIASIPVR